MTRTIKLKAPAGVQEHHIASVTYRTDPDGFVTVPVSHAPELLAAGFTYVDQDAIHNTGDQNIRGTLSLYTDDGQVSNICMDGRDGNAYFDGTVKVSTLFMPGTPRIDIDDMPLDFNGQVRHIGAIQLQDPLHDDSSQYPPAKLDAYYDEGADTHVARVTGPLDVVGGLRIAGGRVLEGQMTHQTTLQGLLDELIRVSLMASPA